MNFESFYGGRQGASFVIVKRFDGLDIPQVAGAEVYRTKEYAITTDGEYFLCSDGALIERNNLNYKDYNWKIQELNGSEVEAVPAEGETPITITLDSVLAEGIKQCFEQGGDTTDQVNYGEYVIIDTIFGLHERSNPDNGKVYRRGMNYLAEDAGAEYIGQIAGPKGESSEISMDKYSDVVEHNPHSTGSYEFDLEDIVPGKYVNEETHEVEYNDNIDYAWTTIRDSYGNVEGCLIGFKFPYLVQDFIARSRSPYDAQGAPLPADFELIERVDDGDHPFYEKWKISIPKGIKGDTITLLETYETIKQGTQLYSDVDLTIPAEIAPSDLAIVAKTEDIYTVTLNDVNRYVSTEEKSRLRVRYTETNYDTDEAGVSSFVDVGKYNNIDKVTLSPEGIMTAYYTYEDPEVLSKDEEDNDLPLRWIYYDEDVEDSGVYVEEDGTIVVVYNTMKEESGQQVHEKQVFEKAMTWIKSITLGANGQFELKYNNDNIPTLTATLTTIVDTKINTGEEEGSGNQKLAVKYSTGNSYVDLGNPLNYVVDCIIIPQQYATANLRGQLLVYYSDPDRRAASDIADLSFFSPRLNKNVTGWTKLGDTRGETSRLAIITDYPNPDPLYDQGVAIPPEYIGVPAGGEPDLNHAGWGVTITNVSGTFLYIYDYLDEDWHNAGLMTATPDPRLFIALYSDTSILSSYGFAIDNSTIRKTVARLEE